MTIRFQAHLRDALSQAVLLDLEALHNDVKCRMATSTRVRTEADWSNNAVGHRYMINAIGRRQTARLSEYGVVSANSTIAFTRRWRCISGYAIPTELQSYMHFSVAVLGKSGFVKLHQPYLNLPCLNRLAFQSGLKT